MRPILQGRPLMQPHAPGNVRIFRQDLQPLDRCRVGARREESAEHRLARSGVRPALGVTAQPGLDGCRGGRPVVGSREDRLPFFREQAGALEERGVDLFILETFTDRTELCAAIEAIRSFSRLPIVAQMTYSEEGTAYGDLRPTDAAAQLKNKNVQVIGANCTLGPQSLLPILGELAFNATEFDTPVNWKSIVHLHGQKP